MTTMRSLAIIALLIGGTAPALSQDAPPRDDYPPPAAGASGTPATYGPALLRPWLPSRPRPWRRTSSRTKAPAPTVKATVMSDSEMDKVTAGSVYNEAAGRSSIPCLPCQRSRSNRVLLNLSRQS
jgi:hypothetical protein